MPDKTSQMNLKPSWSQSKESRFKNYNKSTPGPGSYTIPARGAEGHRFTTRCKPNVNSELLAHGISATPFKERTRTGPGTYNPPSSGHFKKISYSMSGVSDKFVRGTDRAYNTPGPGEYSSSDLQHYKSIPGGKITKGPRKSYFLKTTVTGNPDAGRYEK